MIHVSLGIPCVYLSKLTWVFGLFRQVTPRWTSEQFFAFISLFLRRRSHVMAVPAEPNAEALANLMEAQPVQQVQQQGQQPQVPPQQPQVPAVAAADAQQAQVGEVFCSKFLTLFFVLVRCSSRRFRLRLLI